MIYMYVLNSLVVCVYELTLYNVIYVKGEHLLFMSMKSMSIIIYIEESK